MFIASHNKNSLINFKRKGLNQPKKKTPNFHRFEILPICMTKMHETRKHMKKEGYKGLTGLRGQKPCKRTRGKRQKFSLTP